MKLEFSVDQSEPDIGAVPLNRQSTSELLRQIIAGCPGKRVIFDLDSTLLDNRPRNARIMREFAQAENQPLLSGACIEHFQDWSPSNTMAAIGLDAEMIERLLDSYGEFWQERFFTSAYCQYDSAIAGATELVCLLAEAGAFITYLTGRHEAMRQGTLASLVKLGFPDPSADCRDSGIELITKRTFDEPDDTYKQTMINQLMSHPAVYAAFDNEPAHINSYRSAFPDATCVHLLTDHSMRSVKLAAGIVSILDFQLVEESIPPE